MLNLGAGIYVYAYVCVYIYMCARMFPIYMCGAVWYADMHVGMYVCMCIFVHMSFVTVCASVAWVCIFICIRVCKCI
jgi:hypothetical protein